MVRFKVKREIKKLTKELFENCQWSDEDTFFCGYIRWPENLKNLFKKIIESGDLTENEEVCFQFEYWKDEGKLQYLLAFDDETICINDKIQCKFLDNLAMEVVNSSI